MPPVQSYLASLEEKTELTPKYTEYSFELIKPHHLEFQAGQYISLKVNAEGLRRAYSISSSPDIKHQLELLVDLSPNGPGIKFFKSLEFGQKVEFLAPVGQFIVPADLPGEIDHLVFVATGSGVAPFKSMIEDELRNKKTQRQLTLHWGQRHAQNLFWLEEFRELSETFDNFHFHPVLSQAPEQWTLCRGRVTDCLTVHQLPTNAAFFLCGGRAMLQDVTQLLIKQGVAKNLIFTEKFY